MNLWRARHLRRTAVLLAAIIVQMGLPLVPARLMPSARADGPVPSGTQRVSVSSSGAETWGLPSHNPSISYDGRWIAFDSAGRNLVADDRNIASDVFVHDRVAHTTERVSLSSLGIEGNGRSRDPAISGDGRYVAFMSIATNLDPLLFRRVWDDDIYLKDRLAGTLTRITAGSPGSSGGRTASQNPQISSDGRFVVFESYAPNLVLGDVNNALDIFVYDRVQGTTSLVSVD